MKRPLLNEVAGKSNIHVQTAIYVSRRALGRAHVPPAKVFLRLTASVKETIVKPRLAAATNTYMSDFPRKIPRSMIR